MRGAAFATGGHLYRQDEIAPFEHVVTLRRVARQKMELSERDRSLSAGPAHEDIRVQGGKRHRQIGGMRCDTFIGPPENGVIAIEPITRRTAGARSSFVAGEVILIAEICAAGALHDVPAYSRHISELP